MTTYTFEIISLAHGAFVVVAPARFRSELARIVWFVQRDRSRSAGRQFVVRGHLPRDARGKYPSIFLHRYIWLLAGNAPTKMLDHQDGDPLNNAEDNIRSATNAENGWNKGAGRRSSSGVRGVFWNDTTKRWVARIKANRKETWLGQFISFDKAATARRAAEAKYHGEFVPTASACHTLEVDGGRRGR